MRNPVRVSFKEKGVVSTETKQRVEQNTPALLENFYTVSNGSLILIGISVLNRI